MPIQISSEEAALMERAERYCQEGLTQSEMAEREEVSLSGFRSKLIRCGFEVGIDVRRAIVRVRTGETYTDLLARGEIVTAPAVERFPDREPAAA